MSGLHSRYIQRLSQHKKMSGDQTLEALRTRYNGYKFHQDAPTVYNPLSVLPRVHRG
ncbi:MAG TPA: hypothetical protein DCS43_15210 [Verrucomicrobia bacterium]|nr:hypothetical protein [Verrucomicrobiota bacterium]